MIASTNIRAKQISPAGVGDRRQRMAERHDEGHPRQCRNRTERREHVPRRRWRATIATHIRRRHQCGSGGPTKGPPPTSRMSSHARTGTARQRNPAVPPPRGKLTYSPSSPPLSFAHDVGSGRRMLLPVPLLLLLWHHCRSFVARHAQKKYGDRNGSFSMVTTGKWVISLKKTTVGKK